MPSLPTSLILVGLVVAWLVVLVPMVAKRRDHVPDSEDDGVSFRVLQRTSAERRKPVMSRTAMAAATAVDDDEDADDPISGALDDEAEDEPVSPESDPEDAENSADVHAADAGDVLAGADDVPAAVEVDEPGEPDGAGGWLAVAVEEAGRDDRPDGAVSVAASDRKAGRDSVRESAPDGDAPERYDDVSGVLAPADDEHDADTGPADTRMRRAELRRELTRDRRHTGEESMSRAETLSRSESQHEERLARDRGHDSDYADPTRYRAAPLRPGRGGYDPRAAEDARTYRFRQRRRVALVLLLLTVLGAGAGAWGYSVGWMTAAGAGVLLVLYLAYLRRQVRIEAEIRERRAARLARARQIRPGYKPSVAEQVRAHRTGQQPRVGVDDRAAGAYRAYSHVRGTVPPAAYLPGQPVDLDDSDPAFDELDYYQPELYRRRAG